MSNDRFEAIESRQAFQDDLLQQLDDALGYQQRKIMELESRVSRLMIRIEELENSMNDAGGHQDDGPPPHY